MQTQVKSIKVSRMFTLKEKEYPKINLQGKWLAELGFQKEDVVDIICTPNQIIIKRKEESIIP